MPNVEECLKRGENLLAPRNSREHILYFLNYIWLVRDIRRVIDELDSQLSRMAQSRDEALKALGQSALSIDDSNGDFTELVDRYQQTLTQLLTRRTQTDERLKSLREGLDAQREQRQSASEAHDTPIKSLKLELSNAQARLAEQESTEEPTTEVAQFQRSIQSLQSDIAAAIHAKEKALQVYDDRIVELEVDLLDVETACVRLERRQAAVTQDLGRDIILNSPSAGRSPEAQVVFRCITELDEATGKRARLDELLVRLDASPVYRVSLVVLTLAFILILLGGWII